MRVVRPMRGIWRGNRAQCRSEGENTLIKVATCQLCTMTFPRSCTIRGDSHWKWLQPSQDYHQTFAHTFCPQPGVLTSSQPITTKHHTEPMQVLAWRKSTSSYLLWFSFSWKLKIAETWPSPQSLVAASFRWYLNFTANRLSVSGKSHLLELLTTRKLIGEGGNCFEFGKQTWRFNQKDQKNEVEFVPAGKMWNSNTLWYKCLGFVFFCCLFFFFDWQLPASKVGVVHQRESSHWRCWLMRIKGSQWWGIRIHQFEQI